MKLINDIIEIKNEIDAIKLQCQSIYTNYYVSDKKITNWINKQEVYILVNSDAIIIQRKRKEFSQVYFFAGSVESMIIAMDISKKKIKGSISVALLGDVENYIEQLEKIDFRYYIGINRVVKLVKGNNSKEPILKNDVELAKVGDGIEINNIMYDYFDIYADQILDVDEIEDVIKNNGVLVIRNDKEIEGFYLFEKKGITSQALYSAVRFQYRHKPLGIMLLDAYFAYNPEVKRHIGWIKENNTASIAINNRWGLKKDGFKEVVMLYK